MTKYIGAKNGKIKIISKTKFENSNLEIYELPNDLSNLENNDLFINYRVKDGKVISINDLKNAKKMKIAFITNYKQACGISTYFENLIIHLKDKIGEYKIFSEVNTESDNKLIHEKTLPQDVIPCWSRGQNLKNLVEEIKKYNPDLIVINHEWGLFSNSRHWLSFMTQISDFKSITVMHSVFPNHMDKVIVEASLKNIVVHLQEAKQALIAKKGITSNIEVIPHGCYESSKEGKLWNFYKTKYTFMQMGFGFQYKSFETCLEAVAKLKAKYPDIFFTALFSESPHARIEHQNYYDFLIEKIEKYNISDNVGIVRGFQSDTVVDAYLRTNLVAVFPYKVDVEHLVYGASGAARLAMSKNLPVITSTIPHFMDLPTIKASNADEIATELDKFFSSDEAIRTQVEKQKQFIEANSWENIANRYVELFQKV